MKNKKDKISEEKTLAMKWCSICKSVTRRDKKGNCTRCNQSELKC